VVTARDPDGNLFDLLNIDFEKKFAEEVDLIM